MNLTRTLLLALWCSAASAADPPESPVATEAASELTRTGAEILGMALAAQWTAPALQARAQTLTDTEVLEQLGKPSAEETVPASVDRSELPAEVRAVYAHPAAWAALEWLPAADVRTVSVHFEDWPQRLGVRGTGAKRTLEVEPLESLFHKQLPAADLGNWWVLEDSGPFSEITLYRPDHTGPACCQVLSFSGLGDDPPTGFVSLRAYLEFEWVAQQLLAGQRGSP